jgi:hypothetical protein
VPLDLGHDAPRFLAALRLIPAHLKRRSTHRAFAASAIGALCGGVAVLFLWRYRTALLGPRDTA